MLKQVHLDLCHSTQDELERQVEAGLSPSENLLISTSRQTAGRGRGAHSWEHLEGALAFSFTASPHPHLTWQALEVAVAIAQFCEQEFQVRPGLKWPNDLYVDAKKCGGILLKHQSDRMLIGVGLNLTPNSHWGHALAVGQSLPAQWERDLPRRLVERYLNVHPMPVEQIRAEWTARCVHADKPVTIQEGERIIEGHFKGLGDHGEALIGNEKNLQWDFAVAGLAVF